MTKRNQNTPVFALLTALLLTLPGCGATPSVASSAAPPSLTPAPTPTLEAVETPTPTLEAVETPTPTLEAVETPAPTPEVVETPTPAPTPAPLRAENEKGALDWSQAADGVLLAWGAEGTGRLKLRLAGPTLGYTYDLPPGEWLTVPLAEGSGEYVAAIYEQAEGTVYDSVLVAPFTAALDDELSPFLRPNVYVDYENAPQARAAAREVAGELERNLEKAAAVMDFVTGALAYDDALAETVESGYLPDQDRTLAEGKGICLDYAALMAAMLRSQGVPCKLAVGDAGGVYHAWVEVWDGAGAWVRMDPTFTDSGKDLTEVTYAPALYY